METIEQLKEKLKNANEIKTKTLGVQIAIFNLELQIKEFEKKNLNNGQRL